MLNKYLNDAKKILLNKLYISRFFFVSFIFLSVFFVYKIYYYVINQYNKKAFESLYELLERHDGLTKTKIDFPINELVKDFDKAIAENKKSSLLPYFISGKALSLSLLDDNSSEEAIKELRVAISALPSKKEFYFLHKLVLSLLLINKTNQKDQSEGFSLIKNLSDDVKNPLHEIAIFYHGFYTLKNKSLEEADKIWLPITKDPKYKDSPYKYMISLARNWEI
jgi:hypothetical protein